LLLSYRRETRHQKVFLTVFLLTEKIRLLGSDVKRVSLGNHAPLHTLHVTVISAHHVVSHSNPSGADATNGDPEPDVPHVSLPPKKQYSGERGGKQRNKMPLSRG
jgi:hypothetical protein